MEVGVGVFDEASDAVEVGAGAFGAVAFESGLGDAGVGGCFGRAAELGGRVGVGQWRDPVAAGKIRLDQAGSGVKCPYMVPRRVRGTRGGIPTNPIGIRAPASVAHARAALRNNGV